MIQKKLIYLIISLFTIGFFNLVLTGCEKDDVCIETPITPQLQIVFEDAENNNPAESLRKRVVGLLIRQIAIADTLKVLLNTAQTDSISIPLNVNENSVVYEFTENFGAQDSTVIRRDTITFNYLRNNVYVNRACGFKTEFTDLEEESNLNTTDDSKWINRINVENTTINNEEEIHITIFH